MSNGMNLAQLQAAVYTATNRPDKIDETLQAVLASTLKMHGLDLFYRDIKSAQVVFDQPAYIQELELSALPRFRKLAFFRKDAPPYTTNYEANPNINNLPPLYNNLSGYPVPFNLARNFIKIISPDNILDDYKSEKVDVGYAAGNSFRIRSSTSLMYGLIGWYEFPNLDISNGGALYKTWIADNYPYAIVYDAASTILQGIGMTDASRKYDRIADPRDIMDQGGLVQQEINRIMRDQILAEEGES